MPERERERERERESMTEFADPTLLSNSGKVVGYLLIQYAYVNGRVDYLYVRVNTSLRGT